MKVNTAGRNGEENDENNIAIAVTIAISATVRMPDATTTCRSQAAASATNAIATNATIAHGSTT